MKFVCDSCRAQYMISDDKVGPAGVKVRCKRCSNVILVKRAAADLELTQGPAADTTPPEPQAPPAPRALDDEIGDALDNVMSARTPEPQAKPEAERTPAPAGPDPEQVEWYVAIGEEQTGPLRFEELRARWESAAVGPDTLAWRTGLADWKPLSQIPELALRLSPRGGPATTPGRGIPIITGNRGAWETSAAAPSAREPAPSQDDGWKPSAASALASLVEQEIQAARKPEAPVKSAPPAPETTNVRALLGNLPEPPPAEPSRLIPIADKSGGPVHVERTRSRTGFWGSPSRGGLGRVAVLSAGIAVGALLLVLVGLWALGVVQLPGDEPAHRQRVAVAPAAPPAPAAPVAPAAPAVPAPAVAQAPAAPAAPAAPPAPAAPGTVPAGDAAVSPAAATAPAPAAGASTPPTAVAAAPAMPKAAPPAPVAMVERPTRADARRDRASRTSRDRDRDTRTASADSQGSVLDAAGKSSVDAAFENELAGKGTASKSGGSTYIPPPPGSSNKPGKLGQGDIMAVVVGQKAAIKSCVSRYKDSGGGTGTLVMRWTILPTGRTQNVAPKGPDHAVLAGCIGKLIKDWHFPEYGGATMAPIEFPFTF